MCRVLKTSLSPTAFCFFFLQSSGKARNKHTRVSADCREIVILVSLALWPLILTKRKVCEQCSQKNRNISNISNKSKNSKCTQEKKINVVLYSRLFPWLVSPQELEGLQSMKRTTKLTLQQHFTHKNLHKCNFMSLSAAEIILIHAISLHERALNFSS